MWLRIITILIVSALAQATTLQDFAVLSSEWLTCRSQGYTTQADYDKSGCVDLVDLAIFAERWCDMSLPAQVEVKGIENPSVLNGIYQLIDGIYLLGGNNRCYISFSPDNEWVIGDGVLAPTAFISVGGDVNNLPSVWTAQAGYSGTATVT